MPPVAETAVAAVSAAALVLILRQFRDGATAGLVSVLALVGLGALFLSRASQLWRGVAEAMTPAVAAYLPFLGKVLGVSWLSQFAADVCREMGSGTLGGYVELCGRAEVLLLCLPELVDGASAALSLLS